jgi:hypothetical protein
VAIQKLQNVLAAKDFLLAEVQHSQAMLTEEVAELRRHAKREEVNMDYLKNVVLQVSEINRVVYAYTLRKLMNETSI